MGILDGGGGKHVAEQTSHLIANKQKGRERGLASPFKDVLPMI